jgi:hypothetical protein
MKRTEQRSSLKLAKILLLALLVFTGLSGVYAQTASERAPIDVNLIIDGSDSLTSVKDEVMTWLFRRLDQILVTGDRVTVWSAGAATRVIYSARIEGNTEREAVKNSIRELSPSGNYADFSGALREAATRQSRPFSYTLLISASPASLSSVLSGPHSNLLRNSRVEEFTDWRALVVGLNIDARVRRAAAAFFNQ